MTAAIPAPFPWFGGKGRIAHVVWERLGDPVNYCEPFFGSGAVLLARPPPPIGEELRRVETANDLDCYVSNFFRCVGWPDPVERAGRMELVAEEVARWADLPVSEADLHAVHRWLVYTVGPAFRERMRRDPEYFDAKIAGRWVWGLCCWIGSGWCPTDPDEFTRNEGKHPALGGGKGGADAPHHGLGVHSNGMHEKLPRLGGTRASGGGTSHGVGVHGGRMREELPEQLPNLRGGMKPGEEGTPGHGSGVHSKAMREPGIHTKAMRELLQRRPAIGSGHRTEDPYPMHGHGVNSIGNRTALYETFERIAARLRHVRVTCGDWQRILTPSVTWRHGDTGIYLDPPYSDQVRAKGLYAVDSGEVAADVFKWCEEHGLDKRLRIALSGYASEGHGSVLEAKGWTVHAWKAHGGYGGQRKLTKNENAAQERIWFSPGCVAPAQAELFAGGLV